VNRCGHGCGQGGNSDHGCQQQQARSQGCGGQDQSGDSAARGEGCGGQGKHGAGRGRRMGFGSNPQVGGMARGMGAGFGGGRPEDRATQISWLEERQRDLEQRAADMAGLIRQLQQEPGSGESPAAG
jgi:hypothetical protein